MIPAPIPSNEIDRLAAVEEYRRLSEEERSALQEIADLASEICDTPLALVTFNAEDEQLISAAKGFEGDRTSRDVAFCAHTILHDSIFQVKDAWEDDRFHDNPLVTDHPNIRFYAGMPLQTTTGLNLGSLCVIDREPRELTSTQISALTILSQQVMKRLELNKAKRELEEQNAQLMRVNKLRTRLMNVLAHDIRGPLGSIKFIIDLMQEGDLSDEERQAFGENVDTVIDQTEAVLENILEWAKGAGVSSVSVSDININEIVEDVEELCLAQAGLKHITVRSNVSPDLNVRLDGNLVRLTLRNLVGNAIKFSSDADVQIEAFIKDNDLLLAVTDHGSGMTEERADQILKGELHTSSKGTMGEKGSGLGLAFVSDMLAAINGKMDIQINPDGGCTFVVQFPLAEQV